MESFLSNRQQRTKINNVFSRYSEIIYGVPQGSILGLLVNIFVDIIEFDITSYANDIAPYNFDFNVMSNLEKSTNSLLTGLKKII